MRVTTENTLETVLATLTGATVYDLEQPRHPEMPVYPSHRPGYRYFLHRRHGDTYDPTQSGPRSSASGLIVTIDHTGTHIDALCHQAENLTLHGGIPVGRESETPAGFTAYGMDTIRPLLARGLLLDVAGHRGVPRLPPGYQITVDDLEATAQAQGVTIRAGDVVLVRTGFGQVWDDADAYLSATGVSGRASEWLAARQVAAVGADNMAWDVPDVLDPELGCTLPGHLVLLVRHGIHILENLNLEELARDRHYVFLFFCAPVKFAGATGAPIRPIAVCPA
jgi:kynurenine formamidase